MGWGDIGGRCTVSFTADEKQKFDGLGGTSTVFDKCAAKGIRRGKKKLVKVCFPRPPKRDRKKPNCYSIVLEPSDHVYFEWCALK